MDKPPISENFDYEDASISSKDIFRAILRAKYWIIFSILILLIGTIYVSYTTPPIYKATASVMVEQANKAQTIFNISDNDNFKISDEITVIKSRVIAEDVVENLWNSNKRNKLYVFGTKKFIPRGQRLRRPLKKIFTFGNWSPENNSPPQYNEVYTPLIGKKFFRNILNSLGVYSQRGTNLINITAKSPHPYEAALIANSTAIAYQKRDKEWSNNESLGLNNFLQERLDEKEKELEVIEGEIEKFKISNEIYDIEGNVSNLLNNLTLVESDYNNCKLEINIIHSQKKYFSDQLSSIEQDLTEKMLSSINSQLFALREQVNEKEAELLRNSTIYGDNHEAVLNTKTNLSALKDKLEKKSNELISEGLSSNDPLEDRQSLIVNLLQLETNLNLLGSKLLEYQSLIDKYKEEIKVLPSKQLYLGKLSREKEVLSNTYSYMRQKMEESRVSMASESGKVRIINKAEEPKNPISPDIPKNIFMAIIFGLFIGIGLSFSFEYFDNTIKSVEFIERKKIPVLAIIPSIGHGSKGYTKNKFKIGINIRDRIKTGFKLVGNIQRRLITHEEPVSPISEAYRGLRTSLMYSTQDSQGSIMVSSPGPGEGKTTTIINLAITYANLGKKTVLIDADLRKPVLNKVFDGNNKNGLTNYLCGLEHEIEKIINNTGINNLDIIYNGAIPPNPSELLGSSNMNDLVNELKEIYDVILFDAPPVMAVTDAVVLSRLVDQLILVVRFGSTDKDSVSHTISALSNVNSSITGVVFNDLNSKNSYYSKSYYSYQEYYSAE